MAKEYDPNVGAGLVSTQGGVKRTEYVFDNLDPVVEYSLWNGQRDEFYRGEGAQLLTMRNFPDGAEGQSYWYHQDGRGSVAGLTKHQGQSTHNYQYDAYGQLLPAQGNWTDPHNHYTFAGKEWDEHLKIYEFGYRLYDPWAGVWLTQEPLPGRAWQPRTWHRYQYAFASPINYYDPYGCWPAWLDSAVQSAAQTASGVAESLSTAVNNARQGVAEWCNEHEDVVRAVTIGAAVVAATAVTVATAGAGAPIGAMIVGATVAGAVAAGSVTLARNAIDENRPWHEDLGESVLAGAAVGFGVGGIGATVAVAPAAIAWGGQVGASASAVATYLGAPAGVASLAGSAASVAAPGGFLLGLAGFYGGVSVWMNPYTSPQARARAENVALAGGSLGMLSYYGGETLNAWGTRLGCPRYSRTRVGGVLGPEGPNQFVMYPATSEYQRILTEQGEASVTRYVLERQGMQMPSSVRSLTYDPALNRIGRTIPIGEGMSSITLGPGAFSSEAQLASTLGHERVHALQYAAEAAGTRSYDWAEWEMEAYSWEIQNAGVTGLTGEAFDEALQMWKQFADLWRRHHGQ